MLDFESARCRKWAAQQREITRIYFFGSRVRGTSRPDSDLDIFVVAPPGAVILKDKEWTAELTSLLRMKVHLNDHFTASKDLKAHINADGLLVFSRHNSDVDFQFEDEIDEIDLSDE